MLNSTELENLTARKYKNIKKQNLGYNNHDNELLKKLILVQYLYWTEFIRRSGPKAMKKISCSTQLSLKI